MPMICLSRGHHGSGTNPPAEHAGLVEDVIARDYLAACEDALRAAGHEVVVLSGISYPDRHRRARELRAAVYVCGHLNAGWTRDVDPYGLVLHDHRSRLGSLLAAHVASELARLPEVSRVPVWEATPDDWTRGAYATISGVYEGTPVGLCYEPGFIDCPDHAGLWQADGPVRVGRALAAGIVAYLDSRETT